MHGPWISYERAVALTGKIRFGTFECRTGLFAHEQRLSMLVEESYDWSQTQFPHPNKDTYNWEKRFRWRRATALDLSHPELRWLIDGKARTVEGGA